MKSLLIALNFLTSLPFPSMLKKAEDHELGKSLAFFPAAGIIIGLITAVAASLSGFLPNLVSSALILISMIVVTGGLHLDGLADSCDGLYGLFPKEKRLEIMHDSRIGVMGMLGVFMVLLLKFTIIAEMPRDMLWQLLLVMPLLGRWAQVLACTTSEYVRDDSKARCFIEFSGKRELFIATVVSIIAVFIILRFMGIVIFCITAIFTAVIISLIKRKIDGMTGDTIGAVSEASELFSGLILISVMYGK